MAHFRGKQANAIVYSFRALLGIFRELTESFIWYFWELLVLVGYFLLTSKVGLLKGLAVRGDWVKWTKKEGLLDILGKTIRKSFSDISRELSGSIFQVF